MALRSARAAASSNTSAGQRGPVEPPVGVRDLGAEPLDHRRKAGLTGLDDLPGDGVGVDHDRAAPGQGAGHGRFPRSDPTAQSDTKHAERQ